METINDLLRALDNKVPASIAKRLDGLSKLKEKLALVREEHNASPTEESQEKLDEIVEFITDTQEDLQEDLSELVDQKRSADLKVQEEAKKRVQNEARERRDERIKAEAEAEARSKAEAEARSKAEEALKAKEKEELEKKELLEKQVLEAEPIIEPEKKSGIGWGGLVIGGALLILSAGAINYFGKRR